MASSSLSSLSGTCLRRAAGAVSRYWRGFASEAGGGKNANAATTAKGRKPQYLTSKEDLEGARQAEDMAKTVSAFMFPWEKRALEGGKKGLTTTEKGYWIVFSGAMVYFGIQLATKKTKTEDDLEEEKREEERKEALKRQRAMAVLRGESIIGGLEDPFEGLTPEEIDEYVKSNTKHNLTPDLLHKLPKLAEDEDEFDGLTPEEINALVEKKAQEGGA
ncbi:hypothetical protein HOP50_04g28840 [Chloropicon primus]|uniref:Uncharacterized protein n=1 Tax=Chloropicon primus TaxID=1764295 RepID=A0A5B8MIX4_9CHLO|nr:hypothetical protein A3770_04p28850 [Chloropicon primus]UPQ99576.1 hypothetical protein HOP50_04g28840 [Chloropicon primus]|eukprot:QDZ20367.1 hypothetical protein A3770_04p28850 [Chloropicon primus]